MAGDQKKAVSQLGAGIKDKLRYQTLLGVTGSGKTFTMANLIAKVNKPTLVIAPNKTLAAQLASELKSFFPNNAVVYFVSYYDYYQPEAYVPQTDTFIEKDASINEEVEKLRHAATSALLSRSDCVVVASVSCIYAIGSPQDYAGMALFLNEGDVHDEQDRVLNREQIIKRLIEIQYDRNDFELKRGTFRLRGETLDIFPPYSDNPIRINFFGDEIEQIEEFDNLTNRVINVFSTLPIWPASHYVTEKRKLKKAILSIEDELSHRLKEFNDAGRVLEAQRLKMRTEYDLEMIETLGFCSGIENYSSHLDGRNPGEPPYTLTDYFGDDFLCIIDESHVTIPQIRGMYEGDCARKITLAEHGFRLPSCLDNRPLRFDEFEDRILQFIYVSATPGDYELKVSQKKVEQINRPTGLLDPKVEVRDAKIQIDDIIDECKEEIKNKGRVLITTLTKRMAEELCEHMLDQDIKTRYLHSDIATIERVEILSELRAGKFDVLVGINLLREGLDLPEVTLVAILDADKEGFLRNHRSLIQTIGRAARNVNGRVLMYAEHVTYSMKTAIDETNRRRELQIKYNEEHNIEPKTIKKQINSIVLDDSKQNIDIDKSTSMVDRELKNSSKNEIHTILSKLEEDMKNASEKMDFELAASLRDRIVAIKTSIEDISEDEVLARLKQNVRSGSKYGKGYRS